MIYRALLVVLALQLGGRAMAQIVCVECFSQNNAVNTGQANLVVNGGMELNTCGGGFGNYYCPNSINYTCDITNWLCTGGDVNTYAQTVDNTFSTIVEGVTAAYLGNSFCEVCSPIVNDTSCVADSGCVVIGIPAGYPNNNSGGYGGTTGVSLEQTVSGLTVGSTYVLEFWAGGEDFGAFYLDGIFGLDIGFGNMYLRCNGTSPGEIGRRYVITFVAANTSHTIKFTNWGHMCSSCSELILDDVQLFLATAPQAAFTMNVPPCGLTVSSNNTTIGGGPFSWDMGDGTVLTGTDITYTYAAAGTYTVTLTAGAQGCGASDTAQVVITLVGGQAVLAAATALPTSGCAPLNVQFTNTGTGTAWEWDFGDGSPIDVSNSPSHLYTVPGNYTVTLIATDPGSCNGSDTLQLTVSVGGGTPPDALFLYQPGPDCTVPQIVTTNLSSGNPISFVWSMGDGTQYTDTNVVHTYAAPGLYFVELLVVDPTGCNPPDSITQIVNIAPPLSVVADFTMQVTPTCTGVSVSTTNLSTGPAIFLQEWDMGDGIVYQMPFVPFHAYNTPGSYTVTLIVYDALACNVSDTMSMVVQVDSLFPPQADFTLASLPDCLNPGVQTTNLSTGSALMFEWDMGDGTQYTTTDVAHTYAAPGTYTVLLTVTDSLGCNPPDTMSITQVFTVPQPIVADFTVVSTDDCALNSVQTFNNSTGSNMVFDWEMGDGNAYLNTTDVLHDYATNGTFDIQLIVSDSLGCVPNDTMVVQVTFSPAPVLGAAFTAAQVPDCNQSTVDCVNQTTGSAPSFEWDMGDGTTYTTTDVTGHVYAGPGQYTITLIATDTLACPVADTVTFVVDVLPVLPPDAQFVAQQVIDCGQAVINATNTSTGTFLSFLWDMGDGTTYTDTSITHTYSTPGTYDVTLVVFSDPGCFPNDTATFAVTLDPITPVVAAFTAAQVGNCDLLTVQALNQSTGDSISFTWDMGDGTILTDTNVVHTYASAGLYTIELTVNDLACGDDDVVSLSIVLVDTVLVTAVTPGAICPDSSTTVDATLAPGATYLWSNGSTDPVITVDQPGDYWVTVTYNNCTGSDTVEVIAAPPQDLGYSMVACPNSAIVLTIPFDGTAYQWETGGDDQSEYLVHQGGYEDTTYYGFQVWDQYGCVHEDSVEVASLDADARLFIPNAFTPDGDGINDVLAVTGYGEKDMELLIFDRWGEQIFSTNTVANTWNGQFNGQVKQDVYVYKLTYSGVCTNDETSVIGHVTVLR